MISNQKVLIAGGSGLIGTQLTKLLQANNYQVSILTRSINPRLNLKQYLWDVKENKIDQEAFKNIDYLINLAGTNIAAGRWTSKQKKQILDSRTQSTALLYHSIKKLKIKLKAFISASAVGYYGTFTSDKILDELDSNGTDFLAHVCFKWEEASMAFQKDGIRTVILRTGVVLAKEEGAFPKMTQSLKFGFIAGIGSGKQYLPWIHLDDLCNIYFLCLKNENMNGIHNTSAPQHLKLNEFNEEIKILRRTIKLPNLPRYLLKILYGEMSMIVLEGSRVSSEKILKSGFKFKYPKINLALAELLKKA